MLVDAHTYTRSGGIYCDVCSFPYVLLRRKAEESLQAVPLIPPRVAAFGSAPASVYVAHTTRRREELHTAKKRQTGG